MLHIENLNSEISPYFELKNINLDLAKGEVLTLIGSSGSGKSSLLKCLVGLKSYTVSNEFKPKRFGVVFQNSNLFSHLSVLENIVLPLVHVKKMKSNVAVEKAEAALKQVRLEKRLNARPHQLSGGEQQRAAIARVLAMDCEMIYFDEPTSALDPELVGEISDIMNDLKKNKITQLVVTHDPRLVKHISDHVAQMHNGQIIFQATFSEIKNFVKQKENSYVQLFI